MKTTFGDRAAAGKASKHFSATVRQQMAWAEELFFIIQQKCVSLRPIGAFHPVESVGSRAKI